MERSLGSFSRTAPRALTRAASSAGVGRAADLASSSRTYPDSETPDAAARP